MSNVQKALRELATPSAEPVIVKRMDVAKTCSPWSSEEDLELWIQRNRYATDFNMTPAMENFLDCYGGNCCDSIGVLGE